MTNKSKDNNPAPGKSDDREYDVGYGKPPEHTRFKKGVSGNPKGRPRGAKNKSKIAELATMVMQEGQREVEVNERGKAVKMSQMEAIVRSTHVHAIKGRPSSQRLAIQLYKEATEETVDLLAKWIDQLVARRSNAIDYIHAAQKYHIKPIILRTYPDEIYIDPRVPVAAYIGPFVDEDIQLWEDLWYELYELNAEAKIRLDKDFGPGLAFDPEQAAAFKKDAQRIQAIAVKMFKNSVVRPATQEANLCVLKRIIERAWDVSAPRVYAKPPSC